VCVCVCCGDNNSGSGGPVRGLHVSFHTCRSLLTYDIYSSLLTNNVHVAFQYEMTIPGVQADYAGGVDTSLFL